MFWIRSRRHARLRALVLAGADRVFSVAAATATPLVDSLGVDPAKVRIAPTGVPDRFFSVAREPRGEELRIVVVGALSPEKDPLAAVGVVARFSATPPVELRMVGDGPLAAEVAAAIDTAGIGDRVTLLGSVADVVPHLAWADILLQTSRSEGLPGVVLEAAAAGVPRSCTAWADAQRRSSTAKPEPSCPRGLRTGRWTPWLPPAATGVDSPRWGSGPPSMPSTTSVSSRRRPLPRAAHRRARRRPDRAGRGGRWAGHRGR